MSRLANRVIEPAKTLQEIIDSDEVFHHARRRELSVAPDKRVRAVAKCNQVTEQGGRCDWAKTIEGRAADIERDAKRVTYAHIKVAHPYLDAVPGQARRIVRDAWVTLNDI